MNVYIFSPKSAIVKLNGSPFSLTANNPKAILDASSELLIEIFPRGNFMPSKALISDPSFNDNMEVFSIYGDYLVIPKLKQTRLLPYKKIDQKTVSYYGENINVSLFYDGAPKLSLSSAYHHEEIELLLCATSMEILPSKDAPMILIVLKEKKTMLVAVTLPDFKVCFKGVCDSYQTGDYLSVTTIHQDILKHKVTSHWKFGVPFECQGTQVIATKKDVKEHEVPLAFLEEVRLKGDFSRFLDKNLIEKSSLIPSFLGDFTRVIPPINPTRNQYILTYKNCAKYFSTTQSLGKICDFSLSE